MREKSDVFQSSLRLSLIFTACLSIVGCGGFPGVDTNPDTVAPAISAVNDQDFQSAEPRTISFTVVDIPGVGEFVGGVVDSATNVTCTANITSIRVSSVPFQANAADSFRYVYLLTAPVVEVLTPYSCTITGSDGGNEVSLTFGGEIFPDSVVGPADTDAPLVVISGSANINSEETKTVQATVTDESNWVLDVPTSCTEGVQAAVQGSNSTSPVDILLTAPEVNDDTDFNCPYSATDEAGNETTGLIQGQIIAPEPAPDPVVLRPFWGECMTLQSNRSCDYFGGESQFCEFSEPAASCNFDPVIIDTPGDDFPFLVVGDENRFPTSVDFATFPDYSESCKGYITEPDQAFPNNPETFIYSCEAGAPGALTPPSVPGGATTVSVKNGVESFLYSISVDATGQVSVTANLGAPSGFAFDPDGDTIKFAGGGTESDTIDVFVKTPTGDALSIVTAGGEQGLGSQVFIADGYSKLWTFLYFHDPAANEAGTAPVVQGLIHIQTVSQGTETEGGFLLPLVSTDLAEFITDNSLAITEDIVVSARNDVAFAELFDGGAGGGGSGSGDPGDPAGPPVVGGGVAITIPSGALVEPQICPVHQTQTSMTRCQAGTHETLLVVNGASEVAKYSPINGRFDAFFRDDTVAGFPVTDGWEATQAPDHCVLYTDNAGAIYLYDEMGELITADGNGNTTGTDPALLLSSANGALNYRGFDFYKPDSGPTWFLYVVEIVNFDDNGFPETRSRIVRYDYSISGTDVLTNRQVVFEEDFTHFIDLVIVDGLLNLVKSRNFIPFNSPEESGSGSVKRFQINQDGSLIETASFGFDSSNPAQISESFDEGLLLADFGSERFRLYDEEDPTTFQSVRETYNLMRQGVFQGTGEVVGVFPLRNGDYLISGESIEIDRSVVERDSQEFNIEPDGRNNEGRLIGKACLP